MASLAVSKGAAPQRSWGIAGVVCHGRAGSNNGRSRAVAGGLGQLRGGKGELSSEDDEEGAAGGSDGQPPPPPIFRTLSQRAFHLLHKGL